MFPNVRILRDVYNQNPYLDQNQFDQRYLGNYPVDQYSSTTKDPPVEKYKHVGDFTPFYVAVAICAIIGFSLFILNIALGCCSKYSEYWNDRHTGNRWIVSLWTATPHNQPALDYSTELQEISSQHQIVYRHPQEEENSEISEFVELKTKRESEI